MFLSGEKERKKEDLVLTMIISVLLSILSTTNFVTACRSVNEAIYVHSREDNNLSRKVMKGFPRKT